MSEENGDRASLAADGSTDNIVMLDVLAPSPISRRLFPRGQSRAAARRARRHRAAASAAAIISTAPSR